jgi:hypothetical protein
MSRSVCDVDNELRGGCSKMKFADLVEAPRYIFRDITTPAGKLSVDRGKH